MKLTEAEYEALRLVMHRALLETDVEGKTRTDPVGQLIPGIAIFRKLAKHGLIYLTDEDPIILDGGVVFYPTPMWDVNDRATAQAAIDLYEGKGITK